MTQTTLAVWLLLVSGCVTLHVPGVYVRGTFTPARDGTAGAPAPDRFAFDIGVIGDLGDHSPPGPDAADDGDASSASGAIVLPSLPCRVSSACAWERRASAEARARVIGRGAP